MRIGSTVLVRMSCDQRTRRYVARRTAQGKTGSEMIRCLKRFIARQVYQDLRAVLGRRRGVAVDDRC